MDEKDYQEGFADMVRAAERLLKPWRWALVISNVAWAVALIAALVCR